MTHLTPDLVRAADDALASLDATLEPMMEKFIPKPCCIDGARVNRIIPAIPGADFGGRIEGPSYTSNGTAPDPAILASVLAANRPRLMAYALAIAAVTAPIMTPTPRKK